jgi:hypothetical protein
MSLIADDTMPFTALVVQRPPAFLAGDHVIQLSYWRRRRDL